MSAVFDLRRKYATINLELASGYPLVRTVNVWPRTRVFLYLSIKRKEVAHLANIALRTIVLAISRIIQPKGEHVMKLSRAALLSLLLVSLLVVLVTSTAAQSPTTRNGVGGVAVPDQTLPPAGPP